MSNKEQIARATKRTMQIHDIRIWVRENIGRDDVELPTLAKLSDEDLSFVASAIEASDKAAYHGGEL